MSQAPAKSEKEAEQQQPSFAVNLARAYGGALIFSFPALMTMEMWWLGFNMTGTRMAIFTFLTIPLLIGLSYYEGFEDTFTGKDDVRETFIAYAVGFSASAVMLYLFGVVRLSMSADEIIGKISIQALAASLERCSLRACSGATARPKKKRRNESEAPPIGGSFS